MICKPTSKITLFIPVVSLLLLSACGFNVSNPIEQRTLVRAGYLPMVSSLTMYVAEKKGYFAENNIRLQANAIETSNGIARELQRGTIDLAVELAITPLLQKGGNAPPSFRIFSISQIEKKNGFDGILVNSGSTISSLEDLSGKKIATFPGTTSPKSIEQVFTANFPGKEKPIFDTGIRPSDQLTSLIRGEVDAVHAYEPMYTQGVIKFKMRDVSGSIYGSQTYPKPNPIGVAALSAKFIRDNPRAADNVIKAMDQAVLFIRNNNEEARLILSKSDGLGPTIASKIRILPMSTSEELDSSNLQSYLDLLKKIDENKSMLRADQMIYKPILE